MTPTTTGSHTDKYDKSRINQISYAIMDHRGLAEPIHNYIIKYPRFHNPGNTHSRHNRGKSGGRGQGYQIAVQRYSQRAEPMPVHHRPQRKIRRECLAIRDAQG